MAQLPDIQKLNAQFRHHSAIAVLDEALSGRQGRIAMVSSFGAESVVLLHMVAVVAPHTPVLFVQTGMLFAETLTYQMELTERLNLRDVRILSPEAESLRETDPYGALHTHAPDACCALRKSDVLTPAMAAFDGWITGRKRFQAKTRAALEHFEADGAHIKINPLAHWAREDVAEYMDQNRLPRHPLVARGFASIGCKPCTSKVAPGEDPRAGRWRGQSKTECGIHLPLHRRMPNKEKTHERHRNRHGLCPRHMERQLRDTRLRQ
ncbi:phosphoadenylyl-sulfate reductase [Roseobacteraceae bacterium S113]